MQWVVEGVLRGAVGGRRSDTAASPCGLPDAQRTQASCSNPSLSARIEPQWACGVEMSVVALEGSAFRIDDDTSLAALLLAGV